MLTRKTLLQAKIESVSGTAETMGDTDAVLISNLTIGVDPKLIERDVYRPTISAYGARVGRKLFTCSFDVELKGTGEVPTLLAPPEQDALLRACGLIVSEVAGSGLVYMPTSIESEMATTTLRFNLDGQEYCIAGAIGTPTFKLTAGEYGVISFNFTGLWTKPTDVSQPTAVYRNDTLPPIVESIGCEIDSYAIIGELLEFGLNNEITERPDFNSPEGLKGLRITRRDAGGTVNPEMIAVGTKDYWAKFEDGDSMAIVAEVGTEVGNTWGFTMSACQLTAMAPGDRNGQRTLDMNFKATGTDDEIVIFAH